MPCQGEDQRLVEAVLASGPQDDLDCVVEILNSKYSPLGESSRGQQRRRLSLATAVARAARAKPTRANLAPWREAVQVLRTLAPSLLLAGTSAEQRFSKVVAVEKHAAMYCLAVADLVCGTESRPGDTSIGQDIIDDAEHLAVRILLNVLRIASPDDENRLPCGKPEDGDALAETELDDSEEGLVARLLVIDRQLLRFNRVLPSKNTDTAASSYVIIVAAIARVLTASTFSPMEVKTLANCFILQWLRHLNTAPSESARSGTSPNSIDSKSSLSPQSQSAAVQSLLHKFGSALQGIAAQPTTPPEDALELRSFSAVVCFDIETFPKLMLRAGNAFLRRLRDESSSNSINELRTLARTYRSALSFLESRGGFGSAVSKLEEEEDLSAWLDHVYKVFTRCNDDSYFKEAIAIASRRTIDCVEYTVVLQGVFVSSRMYHDDPTVWHIPTTERLKIMTTLDSGDQYIFENLHAILRLLRTVEPVRATLSAMDDLNFAYDYVTVLKYMCKAFTATKVRKIETPNRRLMERINAMTNSVFKAYECCMKVWMAKASTEELCEAFEGSQELLKAVCRSEGDDEQGRQRRGQYYKWSGSVLNSIAADGFNRHLSSGDEGVYEAALITARMFQASAIDLCRAHYMTDLPVDPVMGCIVPEEPELAKKCAMRFVSASKASLEAVPFDRTLSVRLAMSALYLLFCANEPPGEAISCFGRTLIATVESEKIEIETMLSCPDPNGRLKWKQYCMETLRLYWLKTRSSRLAESFPERSMWHTLRLLQAQRVVNSSILSSQAQALELGQGLNYGVVYAKFYDVWLQKELGARSELELVRAAQQDIRECAVAEHPEQPISQSEDCAEDDTEDFEDNAQALSQPATTVMALLNLWASAYTGELENYMEVLSSVYSTFMGAEDGPHCGISAVELRVLLFDVVEWLSHFFAVRGEPILAIETDAVVKAMCPELGLVHNSVLAAEAQARAGRLQSCMLLSGAEVSDASDGFRLKEIEAEMHLFVSDLDKAADLVGRSGRFISRRIEGDAILQNTANWMVAFVRYVGEYYTHVQRSSRFNFKDSHSAEVMHISDYGLATHTAGSGFVQLRAEAASTALAERIMSLAEHMNRSDFLERVSTFVDRVLRLLPSIHNRDVKYTLVLRALIAHGQEVAPDTLQRMLTELESCKPVDRPQSMQDFTPRLQISMRMLIEGLSHFDKYCYVLDEEALMNAIECFENAVMMLDCETDLTQPDEEVKAAALARLLPHLSYCLAVKGEDVERSQALLDICHGMDCGSPLDKWRAHIAQATIAWAREDYNACEASLEQALNSLSRGTAHRKERKLTYYFLAEIYISASAVVSKMLNAHGLCLSARISNRSGVQNRVVMYPEKTNRHPGDAVEAQELALSEGTEVIEVGEDSLEENPILWLRRHLPPKTTVVGLRLTRDRNSLILWRVSSDEIGAITIRIPATSDFSPETIRQRLTAAVEDMITRLSVCDESMDKPEEWWAVRRADDRVFRSTLQSVQDEWFGIFRYLLLPVIVEDLPEEVANAGNGLAAAIAAGIAYAGPSDPNEEIELAAQALAPVADETADDLKAIIKDLVFRRRSEVEDDDRNSLAHEPSSNPAVGGELLLALDPTLAWMPWESLPVLYGTGIGITRLPSTSFLEPYSDPESRLVDRNSLFYLLNPGGDLPRFERAFKDAFESKEEWSGVSGDGAGDIDTLKDDISQAKIYAFFGHGAGLAYYRVDEEMAGDSPVSLLMGCSSAKIQYHDPASEGKSPCLEFLTFGSMAVVGNLWPITDCDSARMGIEIMRNWVGLSIGRDYLDDPADRDTDSEGDDSRDSLAVAVANAKLRCKLPGLVGGALVVYGVPWVLTTD